MLEKGKDGSVPQEIALHWGRGEGLCGRLDGVGAGFALHYIAQYSIDA